jgi:uncharacterized protein (DUF2062 family)
MNLRRAFLLLAWTIAWLWLPGARPMLIAAVPASLIAYLFLQIKLHPA